MAATGKQRRSVVLHFDLNRTVLMSDAAGGRTMENTVDYLLSECTWGYVHPHKPSEWVCVSEASSIEPPAVASVAIDGAQVPVKLITYKQFVDDSHPYQSLHSASGEGNGSTIEQIKAFNKAAKKQRTNLQSAFTGGDGPGAHVRGSFHDVMDKLHFPEGHQRDAAKQVASSLPASRLQEAFSEGKYYLLPSFMNFLSFLAGNAATTSSASSTASSIATENYDFKLVFRTFGDDIPEVAKELELLVEGKHPFFPSGEQKLPANFKLDVSLNSTHVGTFYRDGYSADGTALAVGTLTKLPFSSANQSDAGALDKFYGEASGSVQIVRGFQAIHSKIAEMLRESSTLALRDYWEWWSAHAENGEYGKILLVDDNATAEKEDIVIFFDDHIEAHHSHIVDVRDVTSGLPVPFEKSKRKYLQRVEPFVAITDPRYFITLVEKILQDHEDSSKL